MLIIKFHWLQLVQARTKFICMSIFLEGLSQCSHVGRPREIKKFAVDKLRSVTPVINGRSGGHHYSDKAPPSKAVLLQYLPPDVARRTAITLMVG